jgi:hypothetical protein
VRSVELDMLSRQLTYGQLALNSAEQLLGAEIRELPVGFVFDPGRPITQLVEGTRRIAAGARSLDLAPAEVSPEGSRE